MKRPIIAALIYLVAAAPASAVVAPGDTIASIFLSSSQNEAFRITPANAATLPSSCTLGFAYINATDDNYQAYVAALTSAYVAHKTVQITYDQAGQFCHIIEFGVFG